VGQKRKRKFRKIADIEDSNEVAGGMEASPTKPEGGDAPQEEKVADSADAPETEQGVPSKRRHISED